MKAAGPFAFAEAERITGDTAKRMQREAPGVAASLLGRRRMMEAEAGFRRLKAHRQLPALRWALAHRHTAAASKAL